MGLINNFLNKNMERKIRKTIEEIDKSNKRNDFSKKNKTNLSNFFIKTVGFINRNEVGRDVWAEPEYDFEEIKRAAETDSYVKIALEKHSRLIYKAGYYLKSENEKASKYIDTRFRIMSYATGKPMDILYQEIADDLIKYSNSIIIKTRVKKIMPGVKATPIYDTGVVGGYFRVDPSTIKVKRDKCGNILGYFQKVDSGEEKKFKTEDVIHIYMDKESSNSFGTPKIIAALEDVKLLRKLEGNVLTIVHRFAIPIFHWKIGIPEQGFQASSKEVDDAKREVEGMSLDGTVITNERTDIKVIGAEGNAIDVSKYLTYFEQRIFTALDTSASQMGRGGAKQDADSMEAQSHDYVKHVQKVISIFVENSMISELLLEGGFNPILNEEDIVKYIFNEINIDTKIKVENHEMLKYQSNLQTITEARRNIGYKEEVDEEELYKNFIEVKAQNEINKVTAEAQADSAIRTAETTLPLQAKIAKANANSGPSGKLSNGKKKSQSPNKDASNRNRPTNQHGSTSAKVRESLELNEKVIRDKSKHKKKYSNVYNNLTSLKVELDAENIDYIISIVRDSIIKDIENHIKNSSDEGIKQAFDDIKIDKEEININLDIFHRECKSTVDKVFKDIKKRIIQNGYADVEKVIDTLEYRFRFAIEYLVPKAKWYSYLKTGNKYGFRAADVKFADSSDIEKYNKTVDSEYFTLDNIPAFHPFCDCELKFKKGGEV